MVLDHEHLSEQCVGFNQTSTLDSGHPEYDRKNSYTGPYTDHLFYAVPSGFLAAPEFLDGTELGGGDLSDSGDLETGLHL
jgi:hypothetical protein